MSMSSPPMSQQQLVLERERLILAKSSLIALLPSLWESQYSALHRAATGTPFQAPSPASLREAAAASKKKRRPSPPTSRLGSSALGILPAAASLPLAPSAARAKRIDDIWRACSTIVVKKLWQSKHAVPFLQPVDPIRLGIPDYFNVIKQPMDLKTIREKLAAGAYATPMEFRDDVRLVWRNCAMYNQPGNAVRTMGDILSDIWERAWLDSNVENCWADVQRRYAQEGEHLDPSLPLLPIIEPVIGGPDESVNALIERRRLAHRLSELGGEHMQSILDIVQLHEPGLAVDPENPETEVTLDLDTLSMGTLSAMNAHLDALSGVMRPPLTKVATAPSKGNPMQLRNNQLQQQQQQQQQHPWMAQGQAQGQGLWPAPQPQQQEWGAQPYLQQPQQQQQQQHWQGGWQGTPQQQQQQHASYGPAGVAPSPVSFAASSAPGPGAAGTGGGASAGGGGGSAGGGVAMVTPGGPHLSLPAAAAMGHAPSSAQPSAEPAAAPAAATAAGHFTTPLGGISSTGRTGPGPGARAAAVASAAAWASTGPGAGVAPPRGASVSPVLHPTPGMEGLAVAAPTSAAGSAAASGPEQVPAIAAAAEAVAPPTHEQAQTAGAAAAAAPEQAQAAVASGQVAARGAGAGLATATGEAGVAGVAGAAELAGAAGVAESSAIADEQGPTAGMATACAPASTEHVTLVAPVPAGQPPLPRLATPATAPATAAAQATAAAPVASSTGLQPAAAPVLEAAAPVLEAAAPVLEAAAETPPAQAAAHAASAQMEAHAAPAQAAAHAAPAQMEAQQAGQAQGPETSVLAAPAGPQAPTEAQGHQRQQQLQQLQQPQEQQQQQQQLVEPCATGAAAGQPSAGHVSMPSSGREQGVAASAGMPAQGGGGLTLPESVAAVNTAPGNDTAAAATGGATAGATGVAEAAAGPAGGSDVSFASAESQPSGGDAAAANGIELAADGQVAKHAPSTPLQPSAGNASAANGPATEHAAHGQVAGHALCAQDGERALHEQKAQHVLKGVALDRPNAEAMEIDRPDAGAMEIDRPDAGAADVAAIGAEQAAGINAGAAVIGDDAAPSAATHGPESNGDATHTKHSQPEQQQQHRQEVQVVQDGKVRLEERSDSGSPAGGGAMLPGMDMYDE